MLITPVKTLSPDKATSWGTERLGLQHMTLWRRRRHSTTQNTSQTGRPHWGSWQEDRTWLWAPFSAPPLSPCENTHGSRNLSEPQLLHFKMSGSHLLLRPGWQINKTEFVQSPKTTSDTSKLLNNCWCSYFCPHKENILRWGPIPIIRKKESEQNRHVSALGNFCSSRTSYVKTNKTNL